MRPRPVLPLIALAGVLAGAAFGQEPAAETAPAVEPAPQAAPAVEPAPGTAPAVEPAPEPAPDSAAVAEAGPGPEDPGARPCRFCPFEDGASGWVEPRVGHLSDDSFRFGDFTGLEDSGTYADLSGAWRYRDAESAKFLDLHAERLGLDSRAFGIAAGRQGSYRAWLGYEALPHLLASDSRTPFAGRGDLSLPGGWSPGSSTDSMSALDASLRPIPLRQERKRTDLGLALTPHRLADLRFGYRRDEIRGTGAIGGSFMSLASELPRRIDQTLDRIDASLTARHTLGHAQLAFESSSFSNRVDALAWENPYNPPVTGATAGQMALAPDNSAHRLSVKLGTPPAMPLQVAAQFAVGRMEQDQRFLPATVNPDEAVALPRASLDARVDTTLASVRTSYALGRRLRLAADVLHDDRDPSTPAAAYTQVVMDTFTGSVRTSAPYGFTRNRWRLSAEHRANPRLAVGFDDDRRERRQYGVSETEERRYWGRMGWRPFEAADLRLRLAHARREGTEFPAGAGVPAQNPAARAYNSADRRRDEARADFTFSGPSLTTAFNVSSVRDDYPSTAIGRTSGRDFGYGTDLTTHAVEGLTVSAFASRRSQEASQAGSQAFGTPDWAADREDTTRVVGMRLGWQAPRGLELGADYVYSSSKGSVSMLAGGSDSAFPLLLTQWHDMRAFARYALRPGLTVRLDVLREIYRAQDWSVDGVEPDTVPNLLAFGQGTQDGSVTAVLLGLRKEFGGASPKD